MAKLIEQKKRQKVLIGLLVVVIIITAIVWYSSFSKRPSLEQSIGGLSASDQTLKDAKLDLGVLDNAVFKALKSYGVLPVTVEGAGRDNPFGSY